MRAWTAMAIGDDEGVNPTSHPKARDEFSLLLLGELARCFQQCGRVALQVRSAVERATSYDLVRSDQVAGNEDLRGNDLSAHVV